MTTGHKLLIVTGAMVVASLLLIAAFALGVYVGEHGWTREGLTLQGPGGGPGRPPQDGPPQGGDGAPGGQPPLPGGGRPPDLVGRIRDAFGTTLLLATPDGPRTVELDELSQVETADGEIRPLDALEPGQHVAIFGRRNGDGQVLIAGLIVLLPPTEQQAPQQP
jgi:hypothetical protein